MISVAMPHDLLDAEIYVDLRRSLGLNLHVKCEGFNFAGSVKLRTARWMLDQVRRSEALTPESVMIESSSGNLGVALATVAASSGLRFLCVTDERCTAANRKLMKALGAQVLVVTAGPDGNLLAARKEQVQRLCASDSRYIWLDQYSNPANALAHYESTGPIIAKSFPELDYLFVGTGTGGTATGCARYFADNGLKVRVIAVDSVGSVNFGGLAGIRRIPGLGTSEPMPMVDPGLYHDVVWVDEADTVRTCRELAATGLLLGGSSGTVISGAREWLARHDPRQRSTALAISPDLGERYLDTIYNDAWVADNYPSAL